MAEVTQPSEFVREVAQLGDPTQFERPLLEGIVDRLIADADKGTHTAFHAIAAEVSARKTAMPEVDIARTTGVAPNLGSMAISQNQPQ